MNESFDEIVHPGRRVDRQTMGCPVRDPVIGDFTGQIQLLIGSIGQQRRQQVLKGDDTNLQLDEFSICQRQRVIQDLHQSDTPMLAVIGPACRSPQMTACGITIARQLLAASRHAYTLHATDASSLYSPHNWLQRPPGFPARGFIG